MFIPDDTNRIVCESLLLQMAQIEKKLLPMLEKLGSLSSLERFCSSQFPRVGLPVLLPNIPKSFFTSNGMLGMALALSRESVLQD